MKEQVIEAIRNTIDKIYYDPTKTHQTWGEYKSAIAEAILNLYYPCSECRGTGKGIDIRESFYEVIECPKCQGTGQGRKMLAICNSDGSIDGYMKIVKGGEAKPEIIKLEENSK